MLGTGATQIRRANYATRGIYFQAFASLSTGLERIGKLSLMLDYRINHGGFPDLAHLKNEIGHDIALIYERTTEVVGRRGTTFEFLANLNDPIHKAIIRILSDFAKGDRYSNIDLLVGARRRSDPIASWHNEIDERLFERCISDKKKDAIRTRAAAIASILGPHSMVVHTAETGEAINDVEDGSFRTGMFEAIAPWRQLYVLHVIRYFTEFLLSLHDLCLSDPDIPHFGEIFAPFFNSDSYMRTRKGWENL